jgi:hypothetical protein
MVVVANISISHITGIQLTTSTNKQLTMPTRGQSKQAQSLRQTAPSNQAVVMELEREANESVDLMISQHVRYVIHYYRYYHSSRVCRLTTNYCIVRLPIMAAAGPNPQILMRGVMSCQRRWIKRWHIERCFLLQAVNPAESTAVTLCVSKLLPLLGAVYPAESTAVALCVSRLLPLLGAM